MGGYMCKSVCHRSPGYTKATHLYYKDGRRLCRTCMIAYRPDPGEIHCRCCNTKLRVRALNKGKGKNLEFRAAAGVVVLID